MDAANRVERVDYEVIERRLLASLSDESKVALVLEREDLDLLIKALLYLPLTPSERRDKMLDGFRQLREEAFHGQTDRTSTTAAV